MEYVLLFMTAIVLICNYLCLLIEYKQHENFKKFYWQVIGYGNVYKGA